MSNSLKETAQKKPIVKISILLAIMGIMGLGFLYVVTQSSNVIVRLSGSTTIGLDLIPTLSKSYLEEKLNATNVQIIHTTKELTEIVGWVKGEKTTIRVFPRGTAKGFQDLGSKKTCIVMASRQILDKERGDLINTRNGDLFSEKHENIIGLDGIAVVAHPDLPIDTLTLQDLNDIFSCKKKNWSELGGPNLPIKVILEEKNSSSLVFLNQMLRSKKKQIFCKDIQRFKSMERISEHIIKNEGSISILPLSKINKTKILNIKVANLPIFKPTRFNIALENYPLTRRLYLYSSEGKNKKNINNFLKYALSQRGQEVIDSIGFVSLNPVKYIKNQQAKNQNELLQLPTEYKKIIHNAAQLSTNIRFYANTMQLDVRGLKDLNNIAAQLKGQTNKKILLVGFSDNTDNTDLQRSVAASRANSVKRVLMDNGIDANRIQTYGLGSSYSVADNNTENGRRKNRRVEIWLL